MPEVELTFKAELKQLRSELAKMPDIAGTEAIKTVKMLEKQWKRSEKAAKASAKKIRDDSKRTVNGLQGLKNAAEGMGGAFGENAGRVEKFSQAAAQLTKAIGPVGVAIGVTVLASAAAVVAFVAVSAAIVSLIRETDKAIASLEEFDGILPEIDQSKIDSLHSAADALDGLAVVGESLKTSVGLELAAQLQPTIETLLILSIRLLELNERFGLVSKAVTASGYALAALWPAGAMLASTLMDLGEHLVDTGDKAGQLTDKIRSQKDAQTAATKAAADAAAKSKALAAAKKAQSDQERELAAQIKETVAALKEQISAVAKLDDLIAASNADLLTPIAAVNLKYEEQAIRIADTARAARDLDKVQEALAANEARRVREVSALQVSAQADFLAGIKKIADEQDKFKEGDDEDDEWWVDERIAAILIASNALADSVAIHSNLRIDALAEQSEAEQAAAAASIESWSATEEARVNQMLARGELTEAQAESALEAIDVEAEAKQEAADKLSDWERDAALKSFKAQKAAAKAQAVIDAARAALALIPAYAFLPGPLGPIAAAATAGTALSAQLAVINAQKPPSFAGGGMVSDRAADGDHVPIMASRNEGIVSPRGMAGLGRSGLDAVNRGAGMGTSVAVYIDRQIIASTVADALTMDPGVGAALDARAGIRTGQALVYGRG